MTFSPDSVGDRAGEPLSAASVFEARDEPVSIFTLDGTYVFINGAGARLLGRSADELIGRTYLALFPDLAEHPYHAAFERVASGLTTVERLQFHYAPMKRWSNQRLQRVDGHVVVYWEDVTARVLAEQALAASLARAAESERQFRAMIEWMPQMAWWARPDGFVEYYNPRWYEYTGATRQDMEGWGWQSVQDPAVLPLVVARWQHSLTTGEPFEMEFPLRRHDGVFRMFLTRVSAVRDEAGDIVRWIGVNIDIDDQKRALALVAEARATAESANRAKDEFMAMLGHELRNPLAPILTALHLMRLRAPPESERERSILERQVNHLVRLVDDLLDVSKLARGKIELALVPVELARLSATAIEIASPLIELRQHRLIVDVPADLVVDGDAHRLAQVVANLLTNAAKYTPPGGRIELTATKLGAEVVLAVRDNGNGIAAALLPHVFDLFVQARQDLDRPEGGLGLGLTIVRQLVALHGGRVAASSDGPGHGATFSVYLPASEPRMPAASATETALAGSRVIPSMVGRRVLIVDDNEDAVELLGTLLASLGFATCTAHDGPTALAVLDDFAPDAALLDIGLPVMDGYELARRIRERDGGVRVQLIAVTGYGQPRDRELTAAAGFDAHLVKPVDIHELAALLGTPDKARS